MTIGCGGGGGGPQPGPSPIPQASIQVTASPSPVALAACPPASCGTGPAQYDVVTTLTLRETAGVAGRVESLAVTVRRNSDNTVLLTTTVNPASVQVPFAANGTATIPFAVHLPVPDVTAQSTVTAVVNAVDANGRAVTATVTIPVNGPPTASGLFVTANYQIVQAAVSTTCGDTGTPATVTGWVTLTGSDTFQLRDTGGTTFNGTIQAGGAFVATAVFGPDASGQTFSQRLEGAFVSGAGFTARLDVTVSPRNCAFTRNWTGTRLN
jgi:hypothetical protein